MVDLYSFYSLYSSYSLYSLSSKPQYQAKNEQDII